MAIDRGQRVLGTRIFDIVGDATPAWVCSDLHIGQGGGPAVEWLGALLQQAAKARGRVFVLGDLFDSYVSPAQLRTGIWREVAALFAAATANGARVAVLHGNRDFLLGTEWQRATGSAVVPGGIRTELAGRRALLLHGDELCLDDLPYQRAKRWLRQPLVGLLVRRLPLAAALRLAARARKQSAMVIAGGDQRRFLPTAPALGTAIEAAGELLVFGHIHRFAHGRLGGGEYLVLPAFDQDGVHLRADAGLGLRDHHGAALDLTSAPGLATLGAAPASGGRA